MKKSFYVGLIALTTIAFASCSQDEQVSLPQGADNAIEFSTYLGRAPKQAPGKRRAPELTTAELQKQGFGIFASYTKNEDWQASAHKPNFMFNQKITHDGATGWDYSPKKYWPKTVGEKITFFAYGPYTDVDGIAAVAEKSLNSHNGTPVLTYTLNNDANKVVDFVAAVKKNVSRTSSDEDANTVAFELRHELTRMKFQGKLDRDAWTGAKPYLTQINITGVKIEAEGDFYTVADYKFGEDEYTLVEDASPKRGTWTPVTAAAADWTVTSQLAVSTPALGGYDTLGVQLLNDEAKELFNKENYIYMIPTWGTAGIGASKIAVTFSYDIVTVDGELEIGHIATSATKKVYLPATTLQQGKSYNYIFTFGLTEVKVSATVLDWEDGGDSNITVDYDHSTDVTP